MNTSEGSARSARFSGVGRAAAASCAAGFFLGSAVGAWLCLQGPLLAFDTLAAAKILAHAITVYAISCGLVGTMLALVLTPFPFAAGTNAGLAVGIVVAAWSARWLGIWAAIPLGLGVLLLVRRTPQPSASQGLVLAALAGVMGVGWWLTAAPPEPLALGATPEPTAPIAHYRGVRPRNVLLIVVDTLRADHLSSYGYVRETSPRFDAFASRGALFSAAIAQKSSTTPSMATLHTGTYPHTHGLIASRQRLPLEFDTLAERFDRAGWLTAAFVSNPNLGELFQFHQGFRTHRTIGSWQGENDAARVNDEVFAWLRSNHQAPFLLYVHYIDPHHPYDPPAATRDRFVNDAEAGRLSGVEVEVGPGPVGFIEPEVAIENNATDAARYIARYDEEILFVDRELGRLLDLVRELGIEDDTLVAITADHGESMIEHDTYFAHGPHAYETTVHVPLAIVFPPAIDSATRIESVVELVDLAPTLLDAAGLTLDLKLEGDNLWPLLDGSARPRGVALCEGGYERQRIVQALREQRYKLIHNPAGRDLMVDPLRASMILNPSRLRQLGWAARGRMGSQARWELFDVMADPLEKQNLIWSQPETFLRLRREITSWLRRGADRPAADTVSEEELPEDLRQQLRSLGYVN